MSSLLGFRYPYLCGYIVTVWFQVPPTCVAMSSLFGFRCPLPVWLCRHCLVLGTPYLCGYVVTGGFRCPYLCGYVVTICPRGLTFTWWGCYGLCQRHKPSELAHFFLFCACVYFCLYGRFNCISFYKSSRQFFVVTLCSSGYISALLVLWSICLFMKVSFSPDIIPSG